MRLAPPLCSQESTTCIRTVTYHTADARRSQTFPCRCRCASRCPTWAGAATSWNTWSCCTRCAGSHHLQLHPMTGGLCLPEKSLHKHFWQKCACWRMILGGNVLPVAPHQLTLILMSANPGGGAAGQQPGAAAQGGGVRGEHLLVRVPPLRALPLPHRRDLRARRARPRHPRARREGGSRPPQ